MDRVESAHPSSPVRYLRGEPAVAPADGTGLCLSGGGYRAMLFHAGALWRLNEAGLLARLDRLAAVSGGAITAAALGVAWDRMTWGPDGIADGFEREVVLPIRRLARETVDVEAVLTGAILPGVSIGRRAARAYAQHLVHDATLQDLPAHPRIILCSTSLQTGAIFRFERREFADHRVGRVPLPTLDLATAVAASAAFPPVLSPVVLDLRHERWEDEPGQDLGTPAHRAHAVLADGGVYDNLGLETVWKRCRTVLVSDAGGTLTPDPDPPGDPFRHFARVTKVIDQQVRDLRRAQVIDGLAGGDRDGAYWSIRSDLGHFPLDDPLPGPRRRTSLADLPTRLAALPDVTQEALIDWGYACADTAVRAHVDALAPRPSGLPYGGRAGRADGG